MVDVVYRFRPAKSIRQYKEIERCEIYLARPDELNDPMEGYKAVTWEGDAVLWENLLRHYALSLLWMTKAEHRLHIRRHAHTSSAKP